MSYGVAEIFATLQGEGGQTGTPAVFIRLTGCNLWSGHDDTRVRDAERHGAMCPLWCDTDFRDGPTMSANEIVERAESTARESAMSTIPLVVLTGGEPLLQLDAALLDALARGLGARLAIETNGAVEARPGVLDALDWVCVSPKLPDPAIRVRTGQEIKVVVPAYDPDDYRDLARGFEHHFVQPEAHTTAVGESQLSNPATEAAIAYCLSNPSWRLSVQTHKIIGLP